MLDMFIKFFFNSFSWKVNASWSLFHYTLLHDFAINRGNDREVMIPWKKYLSNCVNKHIYKLVLF